MKVTYAMTKAPRGARLLALAHKCQGMLGRGEVASMADLARLGRVSRARLTQIMDLMMLAPEIQEELVFHLEVLREVRVVQEEVREVDEWRERSLAYRVRYCRPSGPTALHQESSGSIRMRERSSVGGGSPSSAANSASGTWPRNGG
jgi:hypothetical protein